MKSGSTDLTATWRCACIVAMSVSTITGCSQRTSTNEAADARGKVASAPHDALADAVGPASTNQAAERVCETSQLALAVDAGDGRFNGMSHSGTSVQLSNSGAIACTVAAQVRLGFTDPGGKLLDITAGEPNAEQAADVHPLTLAPGAMITSDLRWISGDVFNHGHCVSPARLTLTLGSEALSTAFEGHLCGEVGKPISYTLAAFKPAASTGTSATTSATIYACQDGRRVQVVYPDSDTAELVLDGHMHHLHTAVSADGARYVGDHWQWWAKGMRHAQLAPLKNGESIASAPGTTCTAR